ncbi:MAG: hypothetical protein AB7P76_00140 [Candidatus Melainabacteria bacterium]
MSDTAVALKPTPWVFFHTHWDREWYEPFRTYQLRLAEVIDAILERLDAGQMDCFALDGQTVLLSDYLALRPDQTDRLLGAVQQGRLTIGPWFVMPDELLISGEALLRNLIRGIRTARSWGCHDFTGYLPDTFGHSAHMPLMLNMCGIRSAIVWRGVNPGQNMFWWQSPDGSRVLTAHLSEGYFQWPFQDPDLSEDDARRRALDALRDKLVAATPAGQPGFLLPLGGDHLGPLTPDALTSLAAWLPGMQTTTPDRFMQAMQTHWQQQPTGTLETVPGELTDCSAQFLLPGVYSARIPLKQAQRQLEHQLTRVIEPLMVISPPENDAEVMALETAWELLLLNTPHDSICGCSVDSVHRANMARYDEIRDIAAGLQHRALHRLTAATGEPVLVNTGSMPFTGAVPVQFYGDDNAADFDQTGATETTLIRHDRTSHQIVPLAHRTTTVRNGWVWVENVPPLSAAPLSSSRKPVSQPVVSIQSGTVRQKTIRLENGLVAAEIHLPTGKNAATGGTVTLTDCRRNLRYEHTHRILDYPDQGDSYNRAPVPGSHPTAYRLCDARLTQTGPLVAEVELTYSRTGKATGHHLLHTTLTVTAGSPRITAHSRWINHDPGHTLQVVFPTKGPMTCVLAEGHFGTVTRTYNPDYRMAEAMPVAPWKELKTSTGPVQRFAAANDQAWITEGLCEYEVMGADFHITLMRAFGLLSSNETGVRGAQAGPPLPTPEAQYPESPMEARYAWLPQPEETHRLYTEADHFYGDCFTVSPTAYLPASPTSETPAGHSVFSWDAPEVIMSALYRENNQIILRLINTTDQTVPVTLSTSLQLQNALPTNALGEPLPDAAISGREGVLAFTFPPLSVRTLVFSVQ